jgi:hypothetical protein
MEKHWKNNLGTIKNRITWMKSVGVDALKSNMKRMIDGVEQ